jgi:hypothetical protein
VIDVPAQRATARVHSRPRQESEARPLRGATILFTFIAVIGSLHALAMIGVEISRTLYSQAEIQRLQGEIAAIEAEMGELQAIVTHGNDERFREQLARQHGFVYPHEQRLVTIPAGRMPQPAGTFD